MLLLNDDLDGCIFRPVFVSERRLAVLNSNHSPLQTKEAGQPVFRRFQHSVLRLRKCNVLAGTHGARLPVPTYRCANNDFAAGVIQAAVHVAVQHACNNPLAQLFSFSTSGHVPEL